MKAPYPTSVVSRTDLLRAKHEPNPCGNRGQRRAAAQVGRKAPKDCKCAYHLGLADQDGPSQQDES